MNWNPLTWFRSGQQSYKVIHARREAQDDRHATHWVNYTASSPNGDDNWTRAKIRNKVRGERENNDAFDGAITAYGGDLIGTGPRLFLTFDSPELDEKAREVEASFASWCMDERVQWMEKLALLSEAGPLDGDTFLLCEANELVSHAVKMSIRNLECDQVTTPHGRFTEIDGCELGEDGYPKNWIVLKEHPSDSSTFLNQAVTIPSEFMCHWSKPKRCGQIRTTSQFAPSIESLASLRRYSINEEIRQESASAMTVFYTFPDTGDNEDPPPYRALERLPLKAGGMIGFPEGQTQTIAEPAQHPTNFMDWIKHTLTRCLRPLLLPRGVASGDNSDSNYSQHRGDMRYYEGSIWRERHRLRIRVLDKVFRVWYGFALAAGVIPAELPSFDKWKIEFHYDAMISIDPEKDAKATQILLQNKLLTYAEYFAGQGLDWKMQFRQLKQEQDYADEIGLKLSAPVPAKNSETPPDESEEDTKLENGNGRQRKVRALAGKR